MRSIASMSTWPWAPAPSSATLISCRPAAAAGVAAAAASLPRAVLPAAGSRRSRRARARGPWTAPSAGRADPASVARRPRRVSGPSPCRPRPPSVVSRCRGSRREYTRALTVASRGSSIAVAITGRVPSPRASTAGTIAGPPKCSSSADPAMRRRKEPRLEARTARAQGRDLVDAQHHERGRQRVGHGGGREPEPGRAGRRRRRRPRQRDPRREPPAHRRARPRIQDVVAFADAGRAERGLTHREPGEDPRRLARDRSASAASRRSPPAARVRGRS